MSSSTSVRPLVQGLTHGLRILAFVALPVIFVLGSLGGNDVSYVDDTLTSLPGVTNARDLAPGSPTALVAEHDCWTGDAPADMVGVLPGHVVVTLPNGTPVYAGERMVGKALAQLFDGADHGLHVKGFCR